MLNNYENKTRQELIDKNKNKKVLIIILIIIIIILLLLLLLGYRLGVIGYDCRSDNLAPAFNEDIKQILVTDDKQEIDTNTELDIFSNVKFENRHMIAPRSYGSYKFVIKNISKENLSYDINFSDTMTNPVNMKYRLKIDNIYIRGNEDEYVSLSELKVSNISVLSNSNNVFTLDWYWVDDDINDTNTGILKEDQYYTLNLEVTLSE